MKHEAGGRVTRAIVAAVPFVVATLAVAALGSDHSAWGFVLLLGGIAFQACVVSLRRQHRMFGVELAAGLLLVGLFAAMFTGPRTGVLLLMPAGFAYLFVGLSLIQHEAVRERLRRALPHRRGPPDESATAVRRDLASLGLVVPACALALLLVPIATWTFPVRAVGSPGEARVRRDDIPPPPEPDAHGIFGRGPPPADTPDRSLQRAAYIEVRPWVQGMRADDIGALYLRGIPLVETGSDRWREDFSGLRPMADADDGTADEWCAVRVRPDGKDSLVLEVKEVVPELAPTGELVLLGPPNESAFEVPQMRAKAGGPYLVPRPRAGEAFEYRVEATLPWRVAAPGTRIVRRAPIRVAADDESPTSSVLAVEAKRAAVGIEGDVERVRAVMRTLRAAYAYETPDANPNAGTSLAEFVAAHRGTCIQFAKAGVVMLRHLGIASRVGTGFLVFDWDDQRAAYVASARDRHAWVEVEIEGSGWVVFDPTPAAPDAAPQPQPDPTMPPETSGDRPQQDDAQQPEMPPEPPKSPDSVRMAISDVRSVLRSIGRSIVEHWPWFAAAALVSCFFAVRQARARGQRLAGERPAGAVARGPWESLLVELARRGHRRRAAQTASEFARGVVELGGANYAAFVPLTARREAARFGALDLTEDDEAEVDAFRRSLPPK